MPPSTKTIAKFMRVAAEMIELMSDSELNSFIGTMPGKPQIRRVENIARERRPILPAQDISYIAARLEAVPTREAAMTLLKDAGLSRQDLIALGKVKSAHIAKQDTMDHIREKLVEAFVGAKLSSLAIRGDS